MDSFDYVQTKNRETVSSTLRRQKSVSEHLNNKKKTDNLANPNFTRADHTRQQWEQESQQWHALPRRADLPRKVKKVHS